MIVSSGGKPITLLGRLERVSTASFGAASRHSELFKGSLRALPMTYAERGPVTFGLGMCDCLSENWSRRPDLNG